MTDTTQIAKAIELALELATGATNYLTLAAQASGLIAAAQAEGRDISDADWATLDGAFRAAHDALGASIARRQAEAQAQGPALTLVPQA